MPATAAPVRRPTLAVWKLSSCDGCQLTILDCEDELLALADTLDVVHFAEASSDLGDGPYDLSLVEGSVSSPGDVERLRKIRAASRTVVAIGACATSGGIQALRNTLDHDELRALAYPSPEHVRSLSTSTPIADHIDVDLELHGCPIDRGQLLEVVTAVLTGRRPHLPASAVCLACKRRGIPCLLVARGSICLGPVTRDGCGAICPAAGRGCYGCFGPAETPNTAALAQRFAALGTSPREIRRTFSLVTPAAPPFAEEAARHA